MQNFSFYLPTKLVFGPGEVSKVGIEAKALGERALIITGKSSAKTGVLAKVTDALESAGISAMVFDQIEPNPRDTTIDAAAKLARENKIDFIIGLGGGSPMDAAKGVSCGAGEGKPIWDYVNHGQAQPSPITKTLPIMMIPTLAATGSEADAGGVITNWETHEKAVLASPLLFPAISVIDPELTVSVPKDYTIDGAIDIISHVIESFFTGVENTPIQDRFSLSIIKTVMENLPKVIENPNDIDARSQLSWCSTIALSGIVNQGRGGGFPLHAMEHALSAHYDISHGRGLALLLPRLMFYTCDSRPEKFAYLGEELFGVEPKHKDDEVAHGAVYGIIEWLKSVERYLVMPEIGINNDTKFAQMADDTLRIYSREDYLDNPKKLYKKDIIKIFDMSMSELPLQKW